METVDGNITSRYLRGIDLVAQQIDNSLFYYLFNIRGDVMHTYEYDAFGNERNPSPNDPNPFRYCGEYWDSETQSYYLRARYMNPTTGRFLSEDPIRWGTNWYIYVDNSPVNRCDPSGLSPEWFPLRYNVEKLPNSRVSWNRYSRTASISIGGAIAHFPVSSDGVRETDGRVYVRADTFASKFMPESGERVFLGAHSVIGNTHHAGIIIMVDSRSEFFHNNYFTDNDPLFGGSIRFATLGAGPGEKEEGSRSGYLHAQINRRGDVGIVTGESSDPRIRILHTGSGDVARLLNRNRYFIDNHNNTFRYPSIPIKNIPTGVPVTENQRNSNSFAVGLLNAAGLSFLSWRGFFPGQERPIAASFFGVRR